MPTPVRTKRRRPSLGRPAAQPQNFSGTIVGTMRVVISGASGLIGTQLTASLLADGHDVVRLVRRAAAAPDSAGSPSGGTGAGTETEASWNPQAGELPPPALAAVSSADAVIALGGAGIADHRWTEAYKRELRDSRVLGVQTLAKAIARADERPRVFLAASAIGYYGATGDRETDEHGAPGTDFLAQLCEEWEAATEPAVEAGVRVVNSRFGIVATADGGAFGRLLPLARLGLGGRLGSGRQYWSLVSLPDAIGALRHILDTERLAGPVNVTAPRPATNQEITEGLARALHRPAVLPVPGFALRAAIGPFAEGILMSQRIVPRKLLATGFHFQHPDSTDAARSIL